MGLGNIASGKDSFAIIAYCGYVRRESLTFTRPHSYKILSLSNLGSAMLGV